MALKFLNNGYFAGKVGIGTASADYKLDIGGTAASTDNTARLMQNNGGTAIRIGSGGGSSDVVLLRIDGNSATGGHDGATDSSNYGFSFKYFGLGGGNNNRFGILSDNQTAATQIEAISILQDGNVGIGTTLPGEKLEVAGNVGVNGFITHNGDSGTFMGWSANDTNVFYTAGNERLRIDASGNVGIGIDDPAARLEVKQSLYVSHQNAEELTFRLDNYGATGTDAGPLLRMFNQSGTTVVNIDSRSGSSRDTYFNQGGNFGIGTTSPSTKLQITAANASSPTANIFLDIDGSTQPGMGGQIVFGSSTSSSLTQYIATIQGVRSGLDDGSSDIHFQTTHVATAIAPSTKMTILSGGNVGINTISPNFKLDVDGTFGVSDLPFNTDSVSVLVADETLGPELVTNGNFDSATGWNLNSNWTISGGTCNADGTSNNDINQSQNVGVIGEKYRISYVISAYTQGTISARIGNGVTNLNTGTGTFTQEVTATTTDRIRMNLTGSFIGSVDSLSIKQITSASNQIQKRELGTGAFGDELWSVTPTDSNNIYSLNSGKVGIGNTDPKQKLSVAGIINSDSNEDYYGAWLSGNSTAGSQNYLGLGPWYSQAGYVRYFDNDRLSIYTYDATEDVTLQEAGGNVGIGTLTPGQKLSIEGDGTADENVLRVNNQGQFSSRIWLRNQGQSAYIFNSGTTADTLATGILSQAFGMGIGNDSPIQFYNGATASVKMTIASNGNVGIGTTTPLAKLDVQGTLGQLFSVTDNLTGSLFAVADISGVPILDVNSSGKVGINTSAPSTLLELRNDTSSGGFGVYPAISINNNDASGFSALHFQKGSTQKARIEVSNSASSMGLYTTSGALGITIDSSGNAIFSGNVIPSANPGGQLGTGLKQWSELNLSSSAEMIWGNGDASIVEGTTTNYSLSFNTYDGTSNSRALYIKGDNEASFTGLVNGITPTAGSNFTTKNYVDGLITGATIYRGTWDPDVTLNSGYGNPNLGTVTQTSGYYYICDADGTATPNGTGCEPNSWSVGDWVIWNDDIVDCAGTGTGGWQKIDNSSVLSGVGNGETIPLWGGGSAITDSETLGNSILTQPATNNVRMTSTNGYFSVTDTAATNPRNIDIGHWIAGQTNIESVNGTLSIGTQSGHPIVFETNGLNKMTILSNGDVGIGTMSPSARLEVAFDGSHTSGDISYTQANIDVYNPLQANTDEKGSIITFTDNYFDGTNYNKTTRAAIKGGTDTVGNTADGFLAFYTDSGAANSAEERMRIDNDGRVGINTDQPGNILDVRGDTDITGQLVVNHNSNYIVKINQQATSMSNGSYSFEVNSAAHTSNLTAAGAMKVDVDSGRAFTIAGNGNVGINIEEPSTGNLVLPGEESNKFKIAFTGASASSGLSTVDQSGAGLYIGANSRVNNSGVVVYNDSAYPSSGIYFDGWNGDNMEFYTGPSGNPAQRMSIAGDGAVLINGTTTLIGNVRIGGSALATSALHVYETPADEGSLWSIGNSSNNSYTGHRFFSGIGGTQTSGAWYSIGVIGDTSQAIVCIGTAAHSSVTLLVSRGYGQSNVARFQILSGTVNANGGYANVKAVRLNAGGLLDVKLEWSSGPNVSMNIAVYGLGFTIASSLAISIGGTGTYPYTILDEQSLSSVPGSAYVSGKLNVSKELLLGNDSALLDYDQNLDVDTGTEVITQIDSGVYTAAFFDFVIKKGTNMRAGTVYACFNGTDVAFTETSTQDLGDTSDVTLSVDEISGNLMRLLATTTSDDWIIKSLTRAI